VQRNRIIEIDKLNRFYHVQTVPTNPTKIIKNDENLMKVMNGKNHSGKTSSKGVFSYSKFFLLWRSAIYANAKKNKAEIAIFKNT
jgi:hypothetical protein